MENPILKTENLHHVYSAGTPFEMEAIGGIDLEIGPGEFVGIIGHTGSGKSTLIQHLNGLIKPTSGRVLLGGEDIHASKESLRTARFRVGLVFQYPEYQLFEETVYKDIAFGPKNMGLTEDEVRERVFESARFTGLTDEELLKSPFELSGGQRRRAAIAGVIAMRPEVLILDEPMAGLDPAGRRGILENIKTYHKETGAAVIMVTHNMEEVAALVRRMIVLNRGRVAFSGTPEEVFRESKKLREIGLEIPAAARIAEELKAAGVDLGGDIFTIEKAKEAILKLWREKCAKGGGHGAS